MARGSADRYFQAEVRDQLKLVPEGIEGQVPYKGPAGAVLHQLAGGLRAAMGYTGSATLKHLREHSEFIRISGAGFAKATCTMCRSPARRRTISAPADANITWRISAGSSWQPPVRPF
jgi:hypothetical protein